MRATDEVVRFFSWPKSLPKKVRVVAAGRAHVLHCGEQHAAGAAGRIVDGLALLRVEDVDHQADDAARGVELAGLLVGGVGELLDQVLVGVADDVVADRRVAEGQAPRGAR